MRFESVNPCRFLRHFEGVRSFQLRLRRGLLGSPRLFNLVFTFGFKGLIGAARRNVGGFFVPSLKKFVS